MLTDEALREMMDYDPETGVFVWRPGRYHSQRDSSVAGGISNTGYREINIAGKKHKAHQLAWLYVHGEWPPGVMDHINGNRSDNRIANLRLVTWQQNAFNKQRHIDNKSGFKGVTYKARIKRWVANIWLDGRQVHLGCFGAPEDAAAAYAIAAKKHYGEFATTRSGRRADLEPVGRE